MKLSFKEFLNLDKEEQVRLGTFNEDLSGTVKKKKMKQLEDLLKKHDFWYQMSDSGPDWTKGRKQSDEIHKYVSLLGDEGKSLYKKYGQKAGVMEMVKV